MDNGRMEKKPLARDLTTALAVTITLVIMSLPLSSLTEASKRYGRNDRN